MRVIAGTAKGRRLKAVPGTGTRPTTDKVKEAIFSMIGPFFDGGLGLDLFAGTGSLGIEALSRGLDRVIFIDMEKTSIQIIEDNLDTLGFKEQAEVYRNEAQRALKVLARRKLKFDLILLDPPYKMKQVDELLVQMQQMEMIRQHAIVLIEHEAGHGYADEIGRLNVRKRTNYGETAITIYYYSELISTGDGLDGTE